MSDLNISKADSSKLIFVFVGLPASGKSYTSFHLHQYFNWLGYPTKIFNCGEYRRKLTPDNQKACFFDNKKSDSVQQREVFLKYALFDLNTFLTINNGKIAILDATNSTQERRKKILETLNMFEYQKNIIFIENITTDETIIEKNILFKKNSKDYISFSIEDMKKDFKTRLDFYKEIYQPIGEEEKLNYIKIFDCGKKVIYHNIDGYMESLLLTYLINFRVTNKKIFIARHGQSLFNLESRIGGDPELSEEGQKYAKKLYHFISLQYKKDEIIIFTSNLKRTKSTAKYFIENDYKVIHKEILNEIHGGICENLTYDEVKKNMPEVYKSRKQDKFYFKYPEGESYNDLIVRLKEFILELNRIDKPVLIICHNAIVRVLYSYYFSILHQEIPYQDIPLHNLDCITNDTYFYKKESVLEL